ncbi:GPW/gp25 family protein [Myxococcus sp. K38C18041901]|uniref:GPW/gp25 family protein n=1 Tax=Myxococcus guangdongensis TaxID=2906760 RepID=UPI0020A78489|nr:GPW/gp25 family protein [Myxococcus guangdongensis]MCP3060344.1 GPW/gp25 family protein [Myxococcus guangdongensis]
MADELKTDLRLSFKESGGMDLDWSDDGGATTVSGRDNLVQALTMRLLVYRGHLEQLGHQRYGSRVADLIGEPLDRANLDLLRRYVRQAIKEDPRVDEVLHLTVFARPDLPGAVDVRARIRAITGDPVELGLSLDLG